MLIGAKAALIRGPAGAGKSQLAWDLLQAATQAPCPSPGWSATTAFIVEAHGGRLLVRPAPALAGMLEIRGLGIRRLPYEPVAAVGLVVDLAAADAAAASGPEAAKDRHRRGFPAAACGRSRHARPGPGAGVAAKLSRPAIDLRPHLG